MMWRLLAAVPGAALASMLFGMAIARTLQDSPRSDVNAGTLSVVLAWAVLSVLCIAQRSAGGAWAIIIAAVALSATWIVIA